MTVALRPMTISPTSSGAISRTKSNNTRVFTKLERPLGFQAGVDSGPVIGSAVGHDLSIFNLWGETVLTASRMAETGVAGQIQVTESTYRRLREDFLFRVRGSYYLEGFGEFETYLLAGRL